MGINMPYDYIYKENSPLVSAQLPCGMHVDSMNNETVYEIICLLHEIRDEIKLIKRQISAHDHNIENLLGVKK